MCKFKMANGFPSNCLSMDDWLDSAQQLVLAQLFCYSSCGMSVTALVACLQELTVGRLFDWMGKEEHQLSEKASQGTCLWKSALLQTLS